MHFLPLFDKLQPYLRTLDWLGAGASLGYGLWQHNYWWIGAGVILFFLAWYDPGARIKRWAAFIKPATPEPVPHPPQNRAQRRVQRSGIRNQKSD
jgi:hypothetical protein